MFSQSLRMTFTRSMLSAWGRALCGLFLFVSNLSAADDRSLNFADTVKLLEQRCGDCHAGDVAEGGFSLKQLAAEESLRGEFKRWQKVRERILDQSMPPEDSEPLPSDVREPLGQWIQSASIAALTRDLPRAGPPLLRRLARYEYSNSVRDLLDIHFDAGQVLPEDAAGGEGFSNAAETLTVTPTHVEKYLQAATDALDYAARDDSARQRLLSARPAEGQSDDEAARKNLSALANRAFRRPVTEAEVERFVQLYRDARADQLTFDEAVLYAMRGVLTSPSFLFITETPPNMAGVAQRLTDHELAVRLSYFLWASTPDDELRRAADEGKLKDDEELKKQVLRLLKSRGTHLQDSMEQFVGSWLGTADLGHSKHVDRERHPSVKDPHVEGLRNQPVFAMEIILEENESILSLIDAPWTLLNDEMTHLYRIKKDKLMEKFVQRLVRVNLPDEYRYRGGLVGMGGVLAVSSYPQRSSPVLRGAWVLEKMLGVELPPPPPNIPALEDSREVVQAKTLRERLEQHRRDPACATCHNRMDPIGFALENFDEIGRWRDKDEGGKIDSVAKLPGGVELDGVVGLKQYLLGRKDDFARVVTRKMLGYALGRSLRPSDLPTVESIVERLKANDYRGQELVLGIVMSEPFREKIVLAETKNTPK